ncbi:MAG: hypothetical protein K2N12_07595 [Helicobacter sp.]|nr:hypothetical protein [Helicobacter sp.]
MSRFVAARTTSLRHAVFFFVCIFVALCILATLVVSERSISVYELQQLDSKGAGFWLMQSGIALFGHNNLGYFLPFVALFGCNIILFYALALRILGNIDDALLACTAFVMLPASILSASFIGDSAVVLCGLLAILCAEAYGYKRLFYVLLFACLWLNPGFSAVYAALCVYGFLHSNLAMVLYGLALLLARIVLGVNVGGVPRGFFLDTLGTLALLFSPPLFIYYTYCLYRICIKESKNFLFWVSFIGILWTLLISMRQRIILENCVPILMPGVLLCTSVFLSGLRVRLRPFRKAYLRLFAIVFAVLLFCFLCVVGNKFFYLFLDNPHTHFAYKFQIVKELAESLKDAGIVHIKANRHLQKRLAFYGILPPKEGAPNYCRLGNPSPNARIFEVQYLGVVVERFYVLCP